MTQSLLLHRIAANARFLFELPGDSNADSSASLVDTDFMSAGHHPFLT